jgi:hypothetical protein
MFPMVEYRLVNVFNFRDTALGFIRLITDFQVMRLRPIGIRISFKKASTLKTTFETRDKSDPCGVNYRNLFSKYRHHGFRDCLFFASVAVIIVSTADLAGALRPPVDVLLVAGEHSSCGDRRQAQGMPLTDLQCSAVSRFPRLSSSAAANTIPRRQSGLLNLCRKGRKVSSLICVPENRRRNQAWVRAIF